MDIKTIQTEKAPAAIGPYSQAVAAGGFVFVSGQIPLVPETGEMVGEDPAAQFRRALENLKQVLGAAGCGLETVVSVDVYLTDLSLFSAFNAIYAQFFSTHKPARAVVQVSGLPRGAKVEVKCIAFKI